MRNDDAFKTPAEIDAMTPEAYTEHVRAGVERGLADIGEGRIHSTEDVIHVLAERRRERARRVG